MTEKNCIFCPYRHYTYRQRSNHTTSAAPKPQRTIKWLASDPQRRHSSPFCYSHLLIWMLNVCSMEIEKKYSISWLLSGFFANTIPPRLIQVAIFITTRLNGPYQGSLANKASPKHLTFPTLGILTRSQGSVSQVSTPNYSRGVVEL